MDRKVDGGDRKDAVGMVWNPQAQSFTTLLAHLSRGVLIVTILASDRKHLVEGLTSAPLHPQVYSKWISPRRRNKWLFVVAAAALKIICCFQNICSYWFQGMGGRRPWPLDSPGGNICSGFSETSQGRARPPGLKAGSCLFGIYSGVFWQELMIQSEPTVTACSCWDGGRKRLFFLRKAWDPSWKSNFVTTLPMRPFCPPGLKASFLSKLIDIDRRPLEPIALGEPEGTLVIISVNPLVMTEEETEARGVRRSH